MHFSDRLAQVIKEKNSCLMLGLDPNWDLIPECFKGRGETLEQKVKTYEAFCIAMMEKCTPYICGIKPQLAYFEVLGSTGIKVLENILIRARELNLIILSDAKRGDIGTTCTAYAKTFLETGSPLESDAITVNPFMGEDSIKPFSNLEGNKRGVIVLLQTSNASAARIQQNTKSELTQAITEWSDFSSQNGWANLGVVIGATHPDELATFREFLPKNWFLCPGVGAQGGKLEDTLKVRDHNGLGLIVPVSRSVLYAGKDQTTKTDVLEASEAEMKKLWEAQKLEIFDK